MSSRPSLIHFLYNYQITDAIQNSFTLESHIGLVTNMLLGVSILFELPVLIYFLTKIGLVTPNFLKKYRKHALVVVLILAAIITPPDIASQVIVAIPILILYEISITVSRRVIKKQQKNVTKRLQEFNDYRQKMNDKILDSDNKVIKRIFNLDTNAFKEGHLTCKNKRASWV